MVFIISLLVHSLMMARPPDLPTNASSPQPFVLPDAQVLEAQNTRLRAAVGAERGPMEQAAALQVADDEQANRTRRIQGSPGRGGAEINSARPDTGGGGGGAKPTSRKPQPDYSGDSDPRVKQWEENKKLKERIQKLRDALASKAKAVEDITKDRDRRALQVIVAVSWKL